MLRLITLTTLFLLSLSVRSQSASLFIYSADGTLFNFSLNKSDSASESATAFEVINIDTEIQGLTVFIDKIPSYKKLLFLRLSDSTVVSISNKQLIYKDILPTGIKYVKVDASKLGLHISDKELTQPVKVAENDESVKSKNTSNELLRYSYAANDSLGADAFVLPKAADTSTTNVCDYTLSEKDLKRLKSKLRIFPSAFDQKRMLEEDLEFTCYTTQQLNEILKYINDDEAKFLLLRNIWQQCSDPKNLKELQSTFILEIYQKDYLDFLGNRLN